MPLPAGGRRWRLRAARAAKRLERRVDHASARAAKRVTAESRRIQKATGRTGAVPPGCDLPRRIAFGSGAHIFNQRPCSTSAIARVEDRTQFAYTYCACLHI